jgi:hypothetical protein
MYEDFIAIKIKDIIYTIEPDLTITFRADVKEKQIKFNDSET